MTSIFANLKIIPNVVIRNYFTVETENGKKQVRFNTNYHKPFMVDIIQEVEYLPSKRHKKTRKKEVVIDNTIRGDFESPLEPLLYDWLLKNSYKLQ